MPARKSLRVLCFGDSLTSGFCHFGDDSHPYALKLEDRLTGALPGTDIEVVANGVPGDVAAFRQFGQRLRNECDKRWFDWVIILGGTNDLGMGVDLEQTFPALKATWTHALSKNSKVLALTVPECHAKSERLDARRDDLNQRILTHTHPNFYAFDLKSKIPYHSLSEKDRDTYWDDGLHLSPNGYDWMGNHIADALIPIIQREEQEEQAKSRSKRPTPSPVPNDGPALDEEGGNPRRISQGYVVVRKHDLY